MMIEIVVWLASSCFLIPRNVVQLCLNVIEIKQLILIPTPEDEKISNFCSFPELVQILISLPNVENTNTLEHLLFPVDLLGPRPNHQGLNFDQSLTLISTTHPTKDLFKGL